MNRVFKLCYLALSLLLLCCSQKPTQKTTTPTPAVNSPDFNADSAYSYVAQQVAFGPRVPNSDAHKACAKWLADELQRHGAKIYVQTGVVTAYDNTALNIFNIVGAFNPDAKRRIMLFAHWDTRPYADHDAVEANYRKPIDGADDGGSGVGVLLEIARLVSIKAPANTGIDIIFFDAEDYGTPEFIKEYKPDTWCLGSQFWGKNPHITGYKADFGILLDMVGTRNATFFKEYTSLRYAPQYVERVWAAARNLGYGKYFINAKGGSITDDHVYVINARRIPCLDIINYDDSNTTGFGAHWHTVNDNLDIIDKETLKAVGQTVTEVIYNY